MTGVTSATGAKWHFTAVYLTAGRRFRMTEMTIPHATVVTGTINVGGCNVKGFACTTITITEFGCTIVAVAADRFISSVICEDGAEHSTATGIRSAIGCNIVDSGPAEVTVGAGLNICDTNT